MIILAPYFFIEAQDFLNNNFLWWAISGFTWREQSASKLW